MQIPGDMVVNSIIVAMVAHANQPDCEMIYQVGSSFRNPLKLFDICRFFYKYFHENPWISEDGKPVTYVKPILLDTMAVVRGYMLLRYKLPLKVSCRRSSINYMFYDIIVKKVIYI